MTWREFLIEMAVRPADMVGGFAGGVVHAFAFKRTAPLAIISSVVVGLLMANYFAGIVAEKTGLSSPTAAFLIGLGGMALVQALYEAARRRIVGMVVGNGGVDGKH